MKAVTQRGLENAIKLLIQSPEFDRIRLFLVADASQGSGEGEEIIVNLLRMIDSGTEDSERANVRGIAYLDAGAAVGPNFDLFRDSTSPAISDILGRVSFNGRDSAANKQEYGSIEAVIVSPTSTTDSSACGWIRNRCRTNSACRPRPSRCRDSNTTVTSAT